MAIEMPGKLMSFFDQHAVSYRVIHHAPEYTAQEAAQCTHTPGREFAKSVVLRVDDSYAFAVVPASARLDLERTRQAIGARSVRLAREDELQQLCPDSELGAEPPLGNLYGLPVLMSRELTADQQITFNAGTHQDAVCIAEKDFERLASPVVLEITRERPPRPR